MNAKMFSYKVEGILLEPHSDHLKFSQPFDRKAILEPLKEIFATDNFKIDEASLSYKLIDDQLYIQGLAIENEEKREVGFRFGK